MRDDREFKIELYRAALQTSDDGTVEPLLAVLAKSEFRTALFAEMGFPDIRPWYNGGFLVNPKGAQPDA